MVKTLRTKQIQADSEFYEWDAVIWDIQEKLAHLLAENKLQSTVPDVFMESYTHGAGTNLGLSSMTMTPFR